MKKILLPLLALSFALASPLQAAAPDNMKDVGVGVDVGVASSADPRATQAGMQMLRQGGSASDAAMAMMLALTVVEPQSSGIGGGGFLIYHDNNAGGVSTINGRETAPAAATPSRFTDAQGKPVPFMQAVPGGKSVGVPGNMRLMETAHKKWGKLRWAALFQPAIKLADDGFVVNATMAQYLQEVAPLWKDFPGAQKLYWVGGKPAMQGTRIKNPAMAKTLRTLAKGGAKSFYAGQMAKSLVRDVRTSLVNPADMTLQDMAAYKAKEQKAVCAPYRIYVVCGMGPPSSGATTVLQILGTLERFDMPGMGKDDPRSWHLIAEAMQLAYADREKYLGDPDFVNVPTEGLINKQYLASRSALISADKSLSKYEAGMPPGAQPRTAAISSEVAGTSHFVAVDKAGNVATMTSTIEGIFGSQLISGGYMLNNELTDFTFAPEKNGAPVANRVQGGKRPLSSMSPTIVYDGQGKPVLALGSAGGKRIIMHVTKTLIGTLDFGLPLDRAIAMSNIYFGGGKIEIEDKTPVAAMADKIAALGQPVNVVDAESKVNGAQFIGGKWIGAADPRSEGNAVAE